MSEYIQLCPSTPHDCRDGICWLCDGTGRLRGNGSASTKNTNRHWAGLNGNGANSWENVVRASEEVA